MYKGTFTANTRDIASNMISETSHGFASRPNLALPEIKLAYDSAFDQAMEWFQKTLIV